MKDKLLRLSLLLPCLFIMVDSFSQSKKYFAVTGEQYGSVNWMVFRQFDMDGKQPVKTLYIPDIQNDVVSDAATGSKVAANTSAGPAALTRQSCGCMNNRMVAAVAYDAVNNRLFYTQMMGNQLNFLDLNETQPKSYAVTSQFFKNFPNQPGEASIITRMAISADGYGYGLTNDNTHLIRFTTGNQPRITDLGGLADAKSNGENAVTTPYKSWGGDLVADADGNLYLFTIQRLVFKINPATRLATYLGEIKNIPEDYTINAAMVESGANIIVGSSTKTSNYYRVNLTTLEATVVDKKTEQVYNVSDFANENFAFNDLKAVAKTLNDIRVTAYPNPVTTNKLNISFSNIKAGKYIILLSAIEGKTILRKEVKISGNQTENITVSSVTAGTYLLTVVDQKGESIYTNQVILSR